MSQLNASTLFTVDSTRADIEVPQYSHTFESNTVIERELTNDQKDLRTMPKLGGCPNCDGCLFWDNLEKANMCIACGWRPRNVCLDVQLEVEAHLGQEAIGRKLKDAPKGKPALSGWDREKRARAKRRSRRTQPSQTVEINLNPRPLAI
mgnify:FL=1